MPAMPCARPHVLKCSVYVASPIPPCPTPICPPLQYNPRFLEQVAAAAAGGKAVILACEAGGTLTSSANFATGKASRSLKAAWKVGAWVGGGGAAWQGGVREGRRDGERLALLSGLPACRAACWPTDCLSSSPPGYAAPPVAHGRANP